MLLNYIPKLLSSPKLAWQQLNERSIEITQLYSHYVIPLAIIPPLAGVYGMTQIGWQVVRSGDPVKLTIGSAMVIALAMFFAILFAIGIVGRAIHWMAETYGASTTYSKSTLLAAGAVTPLLLIGILLAYPVPLLIFLVGLCAVALSVRILFAGVPVLMNISEDRAFLFSSSIVTFSMVALVAMLVATVILWSIGLAPSYIS